MKFSSLVLLAAGLVHLLPVAGLLGGERLQQLYGLAPLGSDLALLMRHRALLFGLLGTLMLAAAFRPALQPAALAIALISVAGFLLLAGSPAELNGALRRVWWIDAALLPLLLAATLQLLLRTTR
jgi:hypothetical protein